MVSKELEDKLIAKEKSIVAAQKRQDLPAIEAVLAQGFHEIGGSGRLFTKSQVLEALKFVQVIDYQLERFRLFPVDGKCVIVTYMATVRRRHKGQEYSTCTCRSSTWIERNGMWRVIFHQATPLPQQETVDVGCQN